MSDGERKEDLQSKRFALCHWVTGERKAFKVVLTEGAGPGSVAGPESVFIKT